MAASDWRKIEGPLAAEVYGEGERRVVFVHGFTQTGRSWRPHAEYIANLGYEVVTVDAPGHGDSASSRADLRFCADLLAATAGAGIYVGYSMGGRMCLHLAVTYPHIVEAMALIGATPGIADETERLRRRNADFELAKRVEELGVEAFLAEWIAQPLFAGLVLGEAERADRLRNTVDGLTGSLRNAGTGSQFSLWDRLPQLMVPVLAVSGAIDLKFTDIGKQVADAIRYGSFHAIPNAGHAPHLQQPEAFATTLAKWIIDLPPATGIG